MATDGKWKLVRYYQRDAHQPPTDVWYDLSHPNGERHAVDAPAAPLRERLTGELEQFFARYESPQHSGRRIWQQPAPNARMRDDLTAE